MSLEQTKDDINAWADQWEAALKAGIFTDPDKPIVPSQQTADMSYYGPGQTSPTDAIKDCDARYWNQLYNMGGDDVAVFHESKEDLADQADGASRSPNPVYPDSIGADGDLTPKAISATFTEKDIENLAELKLQLHRLEDKSAELNGEKDDKALLNLKQKIDELSTWMTRTFPNHF